MPTCKWYPYYIYVHFCLHALRSTANILEGKKNAHHTSPCTAVRNTLYGVFNQAQLTILIPDEVIIVRSDKTYILTYILPPPTLREDN